MARKREEVKPTIIGRLVIDKIEDKAWLLLLMRKFREAIEMAHYLLKKGLEESEVKRRVTRYLSNAWYSASAIKRARPYLNQPYLKLRKPQLFSIGSRDEKGNRNIKLVSTSEVLIKIPHANGKHTWVKAKVKFGEKHIPIVRELTTGNYSYGASIVLKNKGKGKTIRREAVAKLVKYAREHGVKYYVIENLSKPKPKGTKTAKRKITKMALREFTQQMEVLVPKVDGVLIKVNPAYSSVSARIIAEDLGLDIHTTSAYVIALRGLRKIQKTTE